MLAIKLIAEGTITLPFLLKKNVLNEDDDYRSKPLNRSYSEIETQTDAQDSDEKNEN